MGRDISMRLDNQPRSVYANALIYTLRRLAAEKPDYVLIPVSEPCDFFI